MLIYEGNLHKLIGALSQLGAEKITFPPKPDGHTDRHLPLSSVGPKIDDSIFFLMATGSIKVPEHKIDKICSLT